MVIRSAFLSFYVTHHPVVCQVHTNAIVLRAAIAMKNSDHADPALKIIKMYYFSIKNDGLLISPLSGQGGLRFDPMVE